MSLNPTNAGQLTSNSNSAQSSATTASITLPANTLCLCTVLTRNTTPANLAIPTVTSNTGGVLWVPVITADDGAASPIARLTVFRMMVSADLATTLLIDCGGVAQSQIGWSVSWEGGVDTAGTYGSAAIGQIVTGNTLALNATTLSLALGTFFSTRNGVYSAWNDSSTVTGLTPRAGWSELSDLQVGGGGGPQLETQFFAGTDTAASVTAPSGKLIGIAIEIRCQPGFSDATATLILNGNAVGPQISASQVFEAGTTYIAIAYTNISVPTLVTPGVSWLLDFSVNEGSFNAHFGVYRTFGTGVSGQCTLGWSGSGLYNLVIIALPGTVVQRATFSVVSVNGTIYTIAMGATPDRRNSLLVVEMGQVGTGPGAVRPGWQTLYSATSPDTRTARYRANGDDVVDFVGGSGGSFTTGAICYELMGADDGFCGGYNAGTRQLQLKPHEYSAATEPSDAASFAVGDHIHVVELSPANASAPLEWRDVVAAVDAGANLITVTTGFAGWDATRYYAVEYDAIASVAASQRIRAFLADETSRSTGYAARDAYLWGGETDQLVEEPFEFTRRFRKIATAADDIGTPASVHKVADLSRFANTADIYHLAVVHVNQPLTQAVTYSGTVYRMVFGPVLIPLYYGADRKLLVQLLAANLAGVGTVVFRAVASRQMPRGNGAADFDSSVWFDVESTSQNWAPIQIGSVATYTWISGAIIVPGWFPGSPGACWFAIEAICADGGQAGLLHVMAAEQFETLASTDTRQQVNFLPQSNLQAALGASVLARRRQALVPIMAQMRRARPL